MVEISGVRFPVPPTGTAEKFVGMSGVNLVFLSPDPEEGALIATSSYDLIAQLGLKLGDPRLKMVKTTFSRLTQFEEIRQFGDPSFPSPEPGQPLNAPTHVLTACTTGLIDMHLRGRRVGVEYSRFASEFARHLAAQGMPELAAKLI